MPVPAGLQGVTLTVGPLYSVDTEPIAGAPVRVTLAAQVRITNSGALLPSTGSTETDATGLATLELIASDSTGLDTTGFTYNIEMPGLTPADGVDVILPAVNPTVRLEEMVAVSQSSGVTLYVPADISDALMDTVVQDVGSLTRGTLETLYGTGVDLVDGRSGTVTLGDLYDPLGAAAAAQANLDTHKTSTDHDGRYYTEAEIDALVAARATAEQGAKADSAVQPGDLAVTGLGVTASTNRTLIQAAVDAADAGALVMIPDGSWPIDAAITVNKALTIRGRSRGAQILQATSDTQAFIVTASGVTFEDLRITGPQFAIVRTTERGIQCVGTAGAPHDGLTVRGCELDSWGSQGLRLEHVTNTRIKDNYIHDVVNSGCTILSGIRGVFSKNIIRNITGGSPCYGLAISQVADADPRSADWAVSDNVVDGVAEWEGMDTHGGQRITFKGNIVRNCDRGICAVPVTDVAPLDITIDGNIIDSGLTDGTASPGIIVAGVGAAGSPTARVTATIKGNMVRGHGWEASSTSGGIYTYSTLGLVIADNVVIEAGYNGICLHYNNYGYTVSSNTIIDPWSNSTAGVAIHLRSTYNTGTVAGNTAVRGNKSATGVLAQGLRIFADDANSSLALGVNDFAAATTAVLDASTGTNGASFHGIGRKAGLYGVTPVVRAAAIASPAADATELKTAVDAIRAALTNLGVTS